MQNREIFREREIKEMETVMQVKNIQPNGHYVQAMVHNSTIYVSGQFSVDAETGERMFGTVREETERALGNIELILKEFGSDRSRILKTTAYVCSMEDWSEVNKAYSSFFKEHRPVRTIVNAKELHFGFKVEIEAIAAL